MLPFALKFKQAFEARMKRLTFPCCELTCTRPAGMKRLGLQENKEMSERRKRRNIAPLETTVHGLTVARRIAAIEHS